MFKTEIIGRLGMDAEVKILSKNKVINFNVAHSQRGVDAAGRKTETTVWVSCSRFLPLDNEAKVAEYLKKGTAVFVRGDLSVREYTDKGGAKQLGLNLRVSEIELLAAGNSGAGAPANEVPEQDETMPF